MSPTLLLLNHTDIHTLLRQDELLAALARGFVGLSDGSTVAPHRSDVAIPGKGFLLTMPAWQAGNRIAVKTVAVFRDRPAAGDHGHPALVTLFDPDTGEPVAILDGRHLTTMRTVGAAALSVRHLARRDARVLAVIGAGSQARAHLEMLPRVREFTEIRISSRSANKAAELAATHPAARAVPSSRDAVQGADVVSLCTNSAVPVIDWSWIAPGTHVTSVGFAAPGSELPAEGVREGRLFVETRAAFEPPPVGCAELAGLPRDSGTELGEVIAGSRPGRHTDQEITVYKSMGHAMEDMVAANLVYREACSRGVGQAVHL